eukprot:TRINITY_DN858_c0_g1_i11.p1 TRINITY_DN858_c0_g1~~TRINITY_DN858_c0_g1_i11.p1  ORF type:complete len:415 (+),score=82.21 TRINITY_DN858_c0_g1_i11:383-1627(+)
MSSYGSPPPHDRRAQPMWPHALPYHVDPAVQQGIELTPMRTSHYPIAQQQPSGMVAPLPPIGQHPAYAPHPQPNVVVASSGSQHISVHSMRPPQSTYALPTVEPPPPPPPDANANKDEEEKRLSPCLNVYYALVWIGVTTVMAYFLYQIATQYFANQRNPSTVITFETQTQLELPKITICNWNQQRSRLDRCDYCDLALLSCHDVFSDKRCTMVKKQIASIDTKRGVFNCYQFNVDKDDPVISTNIGYIGSFTALFRVANPPLDVVDTTDLYRVGLQVSFTLIDEEPDVFNEDKFAPPDFDSYFALQKVHTIYANDTDRLDENRFEQSSSMTALNRATSSQYSYIGVSFAFKTLSVQTVTYDPQYTLANFWGDFAGMIGTLMGLDVVKVASGLIVLGTAIRKKNIWYLQDHFNG